VYLLQLLENQMPQDTTLVNPAADWRIIGLISNYATVN